MKRKLLGASVALFGAALVAQGCVIEETVYENGPSAGSGGNTVANSQLVGQACGCDTDCQGDSTVCLLGMCAARAQGWCDPNDTSIGCEDGAQCFNTHIIPDGGVCFPAYDATTCDFVENRHGLCSPTRNDGCDATCGLACLPHATPPNTAGAQCGSDVECNDVHPEATCYSDAGSAEPAGWVDGYCLAFGCTDHAECGGDQQGCFKVAADGETGICMERCGMDLDCRHGYTCRHLDDGTGDVCFAGCDDAALCPGGYACAGGICVDETVVCSEGNPTGWCPDGSWCDDGVCNDQPFACDGEDDALEPNNDIGAAKDAPSGETGSLRLCSGDEDWFKITVPAGKIVRIGIEFMNDAGDLDMVAYEADGTLLGSRIGKVYPYNYRGQESDTEYYGFYSEAGGAEYFLRVVGYSSTTENVYNLKVDEYEYKDGASCTDMGFTSDDCIGQAAGGAKLLPFPFPDPDSDNAANMYSWDTYSNYRFARRELTMAVRNAVRATAEAFPGTTPLGLIDVCQIDGITPGYDVGSPRHPESTHDQGGNIDIAYWQTDGNNSSEIICGDGSVHADGFCSPEAVDKHFVDLPRQAFFMATLFSNPRTRVIGVDQVIGPLIKAAAQDLNNLDESDPQHITDSQLAKFNNGMAYGSGWPYHHHHIHLSFQWWTGADYQTGEQGDAHDHRMFAPNLAHLADRAYWTQLNQSYDPNANRVSE